MRLLLGGLYLLRSIALALFFLFPPVSVVLFGAVMGILWRVIPLVNGLVVQMLACVSSPPSPASPSWAIRPHPSWAPGVGAIRSILWGRTILPGRSECLSA